MKLLRMAIVLLAYIQADFCFAQSRIDVYVSSFYFNHEEKVYTTSKQRIRDGAVYIASEKMDSCYMLKISDGVLETNNIVFDGNGMVVLYYSGKYYYTNIFRIDSMVLSSPYWVFDIEESKYSKKLFGKYYFALSIPPIECGKISFDSRYKYHKQSKRIARQMRCRCIRD